MPNGIAVPDNPALGNAVLRAGQNALHREKRC